MEHSPESGDTPKWLTRRLPASWLRVQVFAGGMSRTTTRQSLNSTRFECRCFMPVAFPSTHSERWNHMFDNAQPIILSCSTSRRNLRFSGGPTKRHCNHSDDDISSTYAPTVILLLQYINSINSTTTSTTLASPPSPHLSRECAKHLDGWNVGLCRPALL